MNFLTHLECGMCKKKLDVTITFGQPFALPDIPRNDREAFLTEQTDEIMCRIAAMLPESYRGYYSEFPRLKELLQK